MAVRDHRQNFYTNNMALAAFLSANGFQITNAEIRYSREHHRHSCYWEFDKTGALADIVELFNKGLGKVEPNLYNDTFRELKRDMFDRMRAQKIAG